jgi:hypothetical protein
MASVATWTTMADMTSLRCLECACIVRVRFM